MATETKNLLTAEKLEQMVAEIDSGGRAPHGRISKGVLFFVPLLWSLFQLWYSSPLPFLLDFFVINDTQARSIHLAFAMFLAYTAFPTFKSSPRKFIPIQDWILALVAAFAAAYIYLNYTGLSTRPGAPITFDLVVSAVGLILLLEATRRALGPPLMVIGTLFIIYAFAGPYMPDIIAHKGASLVKGMSHYWLSTEGVFGVALGVSTGMVFMFVLFGSLLEKAGAGNYFIKVAFAGLGHMRGGPAKAAVVSSAMTGMISGSSIANVVTTGTFTIPLMKKVGFTPEKAGGIECASSVNGQITPPVMGAAAFLMVEYVGISYLEVIKHAFLPAIIAYIALVYIIHLEACKMGLRGLPKRHKKTLAQSLLGMVSVLLGVILIGAATYYGLGWIKTLAGEAAIYIVAVLALAVYLILLYVACRVPELEFTTDMDELPDLGQTVQAGLYFLLPVVVLMWCLTVEQLSPSLSVFWATVLLLVIVVSQRPIKGFFRRIHGEEFSFRRGIDDLIAGLVAGGRNMIGIGVATAAAGIVVGTVTLTGIALVMTEFVEFISLGNMALTLIFTALFSIILGMGLPTTANYIVVSTLMAPVIISLGAQNGLLIPLVAVHLFVFYFGVLADDTPPVGLAAFAAAGISGGDPIRTGIQGFMYDIRTAILPFVFIFNTELLMIGIGSTLHFIVVVAGALIAMLAFASATQNYMLTRNKLWETALLLLVAFIMFRPGFFWDRIFPELETRSATELEQFVSDLPSGKQLRLTLKGEKMNGDEFTMVVSLAAGKKAPAQERLLAMGFNTRNEDGRVFIDNVVFNSPAEKARIDWDQEILDLQVLADRPPKQWMFIPALVLLVLVLWSQKRRARRSAGPQVNQPTQAFN
ncbi:TRAP transporter permease [Desulfoprunum benzoelyticum]|uniref:TRAP transporter 4TM/12TM fusion protein n=1 Tax=Desulfoprunum benzoelyticum TaxID=1506996 RepID=A0A840URB2_9BACT|nr:TRAP transporter permease [Desulfoprunum benzoelyticum]MBB5348185.1 TRAP transporter 4TM/12TM fusion protein [Desulfoprunum benzoelyticum]MBM9530887.1 TRAP transporter permease [Desulfoprunum benzoelyticum]